MPTPRKVEIVGELSKQISQSAIIVGAEYKGLRVAEMAALRRQLRTKGLSVRVIKNTLLRLAASAAGRPEVGELAQGPTVIVFGLDDAAEAAKAIREYVQTARNAFAPRQAYFEGSLISARDLNDIATLPPKPVLIGRLAGGLQGPIYRLAQLLSSAILPPTGNLLNSSLVQFRSLLEARTRQLEA